MDNKEVTESGQRQKLALRKGSAIVICSLLLSMCAAFIGLSVGHVPSAHAATWTQIWNDEFSGSAGTGVNTSNWLYDTGTGYGCSGCPSGWGTGEVETMTNSTNNVYQKWQHLVLRAH
jgi:hypothetical protein